MPRPKSELGNSALRPHWWQWLTVLSLDAPVVAVLWQAELGRSAGVSLGWSRVFVLGASVWLAYAADRWIEGWRLDPDVVRTQRHRFYQRFRWPVAAIWTAVFAADLAVALARLERRELGAGLVLLAAVAAYLLSHQTMHRHHRLRLPKEICVGLLMGGGAAFFPGLRLSVAGGGAVWRIAGPAAFFILLCFANCALISNWERAVDESHGTTSLARQFRGALLLGRAFPWLLAGLAVAAASYWTGARQGAALCAAASGLLLVLVDRLQPRTGRALARVLADVALMTPIVPFALCRLH